MIDVKELAKYKLEQRPRHDIGSSTLFHDLYCEQLRYVPERKTFFYYDGKRWAEDSGSLKAYEMAKEFALSIVNYFSATDKDGNNENIIKYYSKYLGYDKRKKLVKDTQSIAPLSINEFDKNAYAFNCQNGTVNIIGGTFSPHDPMDYISKLSNVWYDPDATSEEFEKFVYEIMEGKQELIDYLQSGLGYSLSSATFHECFFVMYGAKTRNGKGTLTNTIMNMMGDYAMATDYSTFESKKYKGSSGASEDVARLAGSRFVLVSEPPKSMVLDSALIKTMSGNDKVTARFLYQSSFEFIASFKIWIATNYLPSIPDDTVFKSGRILLIPFNKHFSGKEQNKSLKAVLSKQENISGAFNWCLEGFMKSIEKGYIEIPDEVKEEIKKYREGNDRLGEFLKSCFVEDLEGTHKEPMSKAYKIYSNWCKESGYKAMNKRNFKAELEERVRIDNYRGQEWLYGYHVDVEIPIEWVM